MSLIPTAPHPTTGKKNLIAHQTIYSLLNVVKRQTY